jgi:hypothetical protein
LVVFVIVVRERERREGEKEEGPFPLICLPFKGEERKPALVRECERECACLLLLCGERV